MVNNPDGSGTPFNYCYLHDSYQRTSANIRVYVEYANPPYGPITHLNDDAWRLVFYDVSPDFTYCGQDVDDTLELLDFFQYVNSPDGIYNIVMPLRAGGSGSASVKLVYRGIPLVESEFGTMHFISTDINGDDHTNLSDVPLFNTMFQSGIYHKAIDFQYDG
ncbi:MAG: hypothetical protein Q8N51_17840, partial [Gammaproteobacteria bacterium]|nr:hypothetical protein [Gammaproteobacteria bacterium]